MKDERELAVLKRIAVRICNKGLRELGQAFRMLKISAKDEMEKQNAHMKKLRGIGNRLVNSSVRLMGMGYNK